MSALDPYSDDDLVHLYELDQSEYDADLSLYEQFARRGNGPSLELGIGTGRVARHLAKQGHHVVGIDSSPRMLARLEASLDGETARRLRLVEADMRQFDLGDRFGLIYCPLNTFEHLLTTEDQLATLRCVAQHLVPAGIFIFQLRTLTSIDWTQRDSSLELRWVRHDTGGKGVITKMSAVALSPSRQQVTETIVFDTVAHHGALRRRIVDVTMRVTGRFEMELLLLQSGLRLSALYGDADLSPFDDDSDTMIVVAELEGT